jgi:hypothetical protein
VFDNWTLVVIDQWRISRAVGAIDTLCRRQRQLLR